MAAGVFAGGIGRAVIRIALANVSYPATPEASVLLAEEAIAQAASQRADLICFPECFVPGYRGPGKAVPPPDAAFLERAWSTIAAAAAKAGLAVVLGTERIVADTLLATALIINRDGTIAGFQDNWTLPRRVSIRRAPAGGFFKADCSYSGSRSAMRAGATRRRSDGLSSTARTSCFIRISTKRSPGDTGLPALPILRTHFTRKQPCAGPPRIPAISPP